MKRKLIIIPLLFVAIAMIADPVIRVLQNGEEDQLFSINQVRKLVLKETAVDVVNNAGIVMLTMPVLDIVRIEFTEGTPDTPTAIDQTSQEPSAKSEKFIRDGQLFIRHQRTIYNIQGQIIQQ